MNPFFMDLRLLDIEPQNILLNICLSMFWLFDWPICWTWCLQHIWTVFLAMVLNICSTKLLNMCLACLLHCCRYFSQFRWTFLDLCWPYLVELSVWYLLKGFNCFMLSPSMMILATYLEAALVLTIRSRRQDRKLQISTCWLRWFWPIWHRFQLIWDTTQNSRISEMAFSFVQQLDTRLIP